MATFVKHMLRLSLLVALSLAFARPQDSGNAGGVPEWRPPGPSDVRSPCPGLNALANHGIIPHSGRGMTSDIITQGLTGAYNIDPTFTKLFHLAGTLASPRPQEGKFDLNDLDLHNYIEHDASLSRQDAISGDDHSFSPRMFDQVLSAYRGMNTTSFRSASRGKYNRVLDSQHRNPKFTYGPRQFAGSYAETGIYMSILGDRNTGEAPVSYVKQFFEQEKLPYEQGWKRPSEALTLPGLLGVMNQLIRNSPEPLPEGFKAFTVGQYRDQLQGIDLPAIGMQGGGSGIFPTIIH